MPSTGMVSMQLSVADTQLLMASTGMGRVLSRPAVAVMPFENLSGDPEQAYFADGISEDIITSLSNWRWFPVIGRNSTFSLRGKAVGPAEVGRLVSARYVVDGSVRKAGNRVRVTAQLTDASSGHHLWTGRYDREIEDIFELQDAISYAIVAAIEPQVAQAEEARIARTPIENYNSWDLSVQALSHIRRGTRNDLVLARSILQRAISIDSTSSYARSLLALAYFREALFGWTSDPARELTSTRDAAAEAVALDGNDWLAHALYAIGLVWVERAFDRAIAEAEKAVSLNPSAPLAYHFLGCALQFNGRAEESIAALKAELQLDPRYQSRSAVIADIALGHLQTGDFRLAATVAREAVDDSPSNVRAWQRLTVALGMLNETAQAKAALERVLQLQPDFSLTYIDATYPFRHLPDRTMFLEGLHRAGWDG
jgi:TolB-like protein/Tfp pilus assembly protein PilF